jgi:hypothetical protein
VLFRMPSSRSLPWAVDHLLGLTLIVYSVLIAPDLSTSPIQIQNISSLNRGSRTDAAAWAVTDDGCQFAHSMPRKVSVMTKMVRGRRLLQYFDLRLAMFLIVVCAVGLSWPAALAAAKLETYLTSKDLVGRLVLDQSGQQLTLPTAGDRHPTLPNGSTPTYLAIPLNGGEHLPSSLPTLDSASQQGQATVGPLNFDAQIKAELDTTLDASRLAIVDTPSRNYLVEFLPGQVHLTSAKQKAGGTASNPVNELTHLLNTGSTQFSKWTQSGMNELERLLNISNSKTSTSQPSLNLEAQLVASPLPSPIPEPSTWLVFASLIAGAAAWQLRLGH